MLARKLVAHASLLEVIVPRSLMVLIGAVLFAAALGPRPATAEGINLRWGACVSDGGARNLTFACNTNSATRALAPSFVLPAAFPHVFSVRVVIQVTAADLALPAWWEFRACRAGSAIFLPASVGPVTCEDWSSGCQSGGIVSYVVGANGPNTARLEFLGQQSCNANRELVTGVEYVGPAVVINSTRTVGAPSCAGCDIGVCLELVLVQLAARTGTATLDLVVPENGTDSNRITWQGVGASGPGACQAATAARGSTWSLLKSLYR